jgi:protease I
VEWVERELLVDDGVASSRKPDDIAAFNRKMIEEFSKGRNARSRPVQSARRSAH